MTFRAFAPAKVNLFLHVGAPEANGYHPLCSLMVFADVGDVLSGVPGEGFGLRVGGPFAAGLEGAGDNLVTRAALALLEEAGTAAPGLALILDKQLPVAAGLGGGSSDAGAALRLFREALQLDVSDQRLEALAARLGADGPACLWARPVLAQGYGERLSGAPTLPPLHAVLVNAGAPVSTPAVYRELDRSGAFGEVEPPPMPAELESSEETAAWLATLRNDLEAPAIEVEPVVGEVLATLRDEPEALIARVSGSGGTCFAICEGEMAAESLAARLGGMRPGWWVRSCRLGGPWPDDLRA
ncbi:4-(cytidine 5'-diphospho)-2-C-methyl-D-erythritol kinase [Phenylobacterium deserti]|uniref:4-diphosphocytidyl-2-C-methyl-D-erythritol kinase n=1 Tax=Phenylobacterium deserti TaxID=1914756 RepID=A0A328ACH6_9CAUL|nr:4-(cytidine 5'-diphospho)-2-C-methyl-D-erythritol kinase [Phenylobacterium deserti]RAK52305.1 4-(cytidine 5'-diphospho)-2-C-methyl-D-erythritol kinase [Phenylobacterium deserti]